MSDDVQRYMMYYDDLVPDDKGTWIRLEDYESLRVRIESLEQALAKASLRTQELEESLRIDEATIAAWNTRFRGRHLFSADQIDAAWDRRGMCDTLADEEHLDGTLAELGIVACEECGGSGEYIAATDPDGRQWPDCCPTCHGHRWVKVQTKPRVPFVCEGEWIITSQLVDKCGQFGTGDDDE